MLQRDDIWLVIVDNFDVVLQQSQRDDSSISGHFAFCHLRICPINKDIRNRTVFATYTDAKFTTIDVIFERLHFENVLIGIYENMGMEESHRGTTSPTHTFTHFIKEYYRASSQDAFPAYSAVAPKRESRGSECYVAR